MTTETAVAKREPQVAIVPLNAIDIQDVASSAATFDAWLQSATDGVVTLDRIKNVAGALPVVGNIMALVDALGDIVSLSNAKPAHFRSSGHALTNHASVPTIRANSGLAGSTNSPRVSTAWTMA